MTGCYLSRPYFGNDKCTSLLALELFPPFYDYRRNVKQEVIEMKSNITLNAGEQ